MVTDLMGGQVDAGIDVVAASLPHIRSGAVRALAIMSAKRLDALPDVPTLAETFPGLEAVAFTGIGAPRGTPEAVIARLNREVNAGLTDPAIRKRLDELTVIPLVFTPAVRLLNHSFHACFTSSQSFARPTLTSRSHHSPLPSGYGWSAAVG